MTGVTVLAAKGFYFPTAKQFRISSNFNPRRLNPVALDALRPPHRGVDCDAAETPVLSVGDGEVVVAKRSWRCRLLRAIRHGRTYTTRYVLLRKLLLEQGQK